jgi:hypothetical protein
VASFELLESRLCLATNGLSAAYFNNTDFTGRTVQRVDSTLHFDWGRHRSPAPRIGGTTFSVRWTGLLKSPATRTVNFTLRSNDGVRFWLNGKLLIDDWAKDVRRTRKASMSLSAGELYDLRIEHVTYTQNAAIDLKWDAANARLANIPPQRLFAYDTRLAAIGDYGMGTATEYATAAMVRRWLPDFIITVGDNNYPDGEASTIDTNIGKPYHAWIGAYQGAFGSGSSVNRFFPSLGNHDWGSSAARPYFDYFTLPGNERYYDFVRGPIHFFVLDSDPGEPDGVEADSIQGQWLKDALAGSDSLYNVVYFHHPPFSSGDEHGPTEYMQWPFRQWGADVVLSGHDHNYERLIKNGLTYVVNGAGAKPRRRGNRDPGSVFFDASDTGGLLIQANELAITFQYQLKSGRVIDHFAVRA